MTVYEKVNEDAGRQVSSSRVLRGRQAAAEDILEGGRVVGRGHLLSVSVRQEGKSRFECYSITPSTPNCVGDYQDRI